MVSWIIYDVGNTMYFAGIVGLLFPLWLINTGAGDDATIGFTLSIAMALMLVFAPIVGAFSDQIGRRMPLLAAGTVVCGASIMFLGVGNLTVALIVFALSVVAINTADIFYNGMLADVSTEENRGKIGGLGVGLGYIGAISSVIIALLFVDSRGYVFGFRLIGVLFLLVTLPLILTLKERPRPVKSLGMSGNVKAAFVQLGVTLKRIHRFPGLLRFLIARFWYTWAIHTASTFAILYATNTGGFTEREVELVLLASILVAIPSGLIWGLIVDRVGPSIVIQITLVGWFIVLNFAVLIPWLDLPKQLWVGVGFLAGVFVAGIWSADRPYMLKLTTPEYLGEFFGLHSMTSRLATIFGPFTWAYIAITLGFGQMLALLSLTICIVISFLIVRGIGDIPQGAHAGPVEVSSD